MILWYLCAPYSHIYARFKGMQFVLCFIDSIPEDSVVSNGFPKWLLTCKLFLFEGRAMLARMSNITICPYSSKSNLSWSFSSLQVIMPSLHRDLEIQTDSLTAAYNTIGALLRPNATGLTMIQQAMNYLKLEITMTGGWLRYLRLQTKFVNVCAGCQRQACLRLGIESGASWKLDLRCLQRAKLNLYTFELEIQNIHTTISQDLLIHATNHWYEVEPYIEKEVRRVGQALTERNLDSSRSHRHHRTPQSSVTNVKKHEKLKPSRGPSSNERPKPLQIAES